MDYREGWNDLVKNKNIYQIIARMDTDYSDLSFKITSLGWANKLSKMLPNICDKILDYGCGIGRIMYPMSMFCNEIIGVDISDAMIKKAEIYLQHINNKHLTTPDSNSILNFSNTFDFAYCIGVLRHNMPQDSFKIIGNIIKTLKTNGLFYFEYASSGEDVDHGVRGYHPIEDKDMKNFLEPLCKIIEYKDGKVLIEKERHNKN